MVQYNSVLKERYLHAAEAYAKKLKAEVGFFKKVRRHLLSVSRDTFSNYKKFGNIPNLDYHEEVMGGLIEDHFKNVSSMFSSTLRDKIGLPLENDSINQVVGNLLNVEAGGHAQNSVSSIAHTTRKQISKAIDKAVERAAAQGKVLTQDQIARSAQQIFNRQTNLRSSIIATTETQYASEEGKHIEVRVMQDQNATLSDGSQMSEYNVIKMWVAILDDKTRDAHADADGQEVPFDQPFVVDGEEMMKPGDSSLGASLANIIECRCSAETVLVAKNDGQFYQPLVANG